MKRRYGAIAVAVLIVGTIFIGARAEDATRTTRAPGGDAAPARLQGVPDSIARYYPPRDKKRTYTLEMLELGRLMGSVSTDIRSVRPASERARIQEELESFARQYKKVTAMVPEWTSYYATADVKALREGLASGAAHEALEASLDKVSDSCTQCHAAEMFKVQALYHWPSFSDVAGQGASGEEVPFHDTMVNLADRLGALPTAVRRGEWVEARNHQREITVQFALLEDSCGACHQSPRSYFVDERVKAEVMKLGAMVRRQEPEAASYIEISSNIYQRSCIPCHQVHMPAAYLQQRLKK